MGFKPIKKKGEVIYLKLPKWSPTGPQYKYRIEFIDGNVANIVKVFDKSKSLPADYHVNIVLGMYL